MQLFGAVSMDDPYVLSPINMASTIGVSDAAGRTQASSALAAGAGVIITLGQSLIASGAEGTFTAVNTISASAGVHNFNLYDGAIYYGTNPVLGASPASNTNSPNLYIGDKLITAGKFTRASWRRSASVARSLRIGPPPGRGAAVGKHNERIGVLYRRLSARGLLPYVKAILWHQGEADGGAGTAGATYTAQVKSVCQTFRDLGITAPFFVALETMSSSVTSASIRTAQTNCVDGTLVIKQGADIDTAVVAGNRYDGTHPTSTGVGLFADAVVTNISPFI
jgi:hypothetical protein